MNSFGSHTYITYKVVMKFVGFYELIFLDKMFPVQCCVDIYLNLEFWCHGQDKNKFGCLFRILLPLMGLKGDTVCLL